MRAVKVNPPSDKRRSAFRWVVTVTRSCCCGGFTPARFPAGQNFPPLLVSVPGFISDPLKVPSGSKQKNKRVTQRAEDSVWAGHLHRYTVAHLQHAARRWLKRWSWARCPEGSGPCSPCCHRTSHRLRRWRMFLRTCSRWVQPHTDATMMMMKRKRWSSPQVSSAVTWKKSSEHTHTHTTYQLTSLTWKQASAAAVIIICNITGLKQRYVTFNSGCRNMLRCEMRERVGSPSPSPQQNIWSVFTTVVLHSETVRRGATCWFLHNVALSLAIFQTKHVEN